MLLDIGIGIFAAIVVGKLFALELTSFFIGLGVAFALLPDVDFLYSVVRHWRTRDIRAIIRHRDLVHYPLLYLPLGALIAAGFGTEWALLFILASLGHFAHDSIGLGWGIAWLWPLTTRNYGFFYRYTPQEKPLPRRMVYRWEHRDIDALIDEYRDRHWLKNIYLKLHPLFAVELLGFAIAAAMLWQLTGGAVVPPALGSEHGAQPGPSADSELSP